MSAGGPSGLFGEPQLVWDSLDAKTFREGISVRVSRGRPTVRKPTGYSNPILQAERLEEPKPGGQAVAAGIEPAVRELFEGTVAMGGQITGEHGVVGYVRKNYLGIA